MTETLAVQAIISFPYLPRRIPKYSCWFQTCSVVNNGPANTILSVPISDISVDIIRIRDEIENLRENENLFHKNSNLNIFMVLFFQTVLQIAF